MGHARSHGVEQSNDSAAFPHTAISHPPHSPESIPDTGSYEIRFPDGRESVYFYWDDNPGRRSITMKLSSEEAERQAKDLARTEQDKLDI